ncbi:MAG: hypothetical protein MPN21_20495 [Thermoanaerobaculia bacterium]|nr:hypothetical protein [Thermoanaerobaculia bacterium]
MALILGAAQLTDAGDSAGRDRLHLTAADEPGDQTSVQLNTSLLVSLVGFLRPWAARLTGEAAAARGSDSRDLESLGVTLADARVGLSATSPRTLRVLWGFRFDPLYMVSAVPRC